MSAHQVLAKRSDYLELFTSAGAPALNAALLQRFPYPEQHQLELTRMAKGQWLVEWDDETGIGTVVGRREPEAT